MKRIAFAGFRHGHIIALYEQVKKCDSVEIAGSWEENDEARENAAENFGVEFNYSSFNDILADNSIDIVAIGDYYGRRGELAILALKAGKHVIADKPLCTTIDELDEIERISSEKKLCVGCLLSLRYSKYTAVAKDIISSGRLGEVRSVSFNGQHSLSYGDRPMWYFEDGKHGGVINDISIHGLDLVEYLTGTRVKNITAARDWNAFAKEVPSFYDCAQYMVEMTNGCGVMADISYAAPSHSGFEIPFYWQFIIWGDRGVLRFSECAQTVEFYEDGKDEVQYIDGVDSTTNHIIDFVNEIDGKTGLLICTRQVLDSQRDTLLINDAAINRR